MEKKRIIFHIDVNNAFLSWTAVDLLKKGYKKDIRTIPSVIGGSEKERRGIVLAKSPVAKKRGVLSAETLYSARKKCPSLEIYPPDYKLYINKSKELMRYLSQYSPLLEQFSIDECFLDMSGMNLIYKDMENLAHKIKNEVKEKFGYTVNIGIGNNKLCAKMASDFEKPDKVHTLYKEEIEEKLWPLDVGDLFMCGKKTKERLYQMNIHTIKELAATDLKKLEKVFKSQGRYLKEASLGIDESKVEYKTAKNLSISTTETLPHNVNDVKKLKEVIFRQTEEVARQLRKRGLYANNVAVIFKNSNFINYSAQTTLDNPTASTKEIIKNVYKIFDDNYKGDAIRLIGVRLGNLTTEKSEQLSIFNKKEDDQNEDNMQKTIDEINNKFGQSLIKPASLKLIGEKEERERYK